MTTLYVLDIPEFADLVRVARDTGYHIRSAGDYVQVSADGPLVLGRHEVGARPAVWFAALTGGFSGRLVRLDEDELCLDEG
ncbi:hypothetical protein OG607_14125 [Streptomyces sp. NBC_01537]|uniref:hypothetical protein n=1 Tax=Streptomyces sp. NBC_01537 TaxID=2903896 RepID=UPI003869CCEA